MASNGSEGNGGMNPPEVNLAVEPRKPRLAWIGMERWEVAAAVPTQVVEVVRPGRAIDRPDDGGLGLSEVAKAKARGEDELPPNRLIWTNDNLVALTTLLDEKDPRTHQYRYRNKVDLIYIDPPFMVNNDFRADNAIDIEIDDDEGVQVKKEPSLVEILAYKDTWRQGLDSFLSMLRRRLELLKDLLAPTGSIYVHLDWHTVHYVKVLMDELFGYENFVNEICWQKLRASKSQSQRFPNCHDTILAYSAGPSPVFYPVFVDKREVLLDSHYRHTDETGKRYNLDNFTQDGAGPGRRFGDQWLEPPPGKHWIWSQERIDEGMKQGLIVFSSGGIPYVKRYFEDTQGNRATDIWSDINPVNQVAHERIGYPTQKPVALVERVISASCPPNGLVLDCFAGSGTTAEAAERLGRRWICIDNGKYAIHLTRKRMILLHGQQRPPEKRQYDYVECPKCKNIERKEKPQRSPGAFQVRPFSVENMGVYQRAETWQDFQTQRNRYRDEMVKVFGGEPMDISPLLHGRKGGRWVHVGPLDASVSKHQVWAVAREAARTDTKAVDILSADFDTLSASERDEVEKDTGVHVMVRVIPASAIDEVKKRIELMRQGGNVVESMAIPAFYAPLSIVLDASLDGRRVVLTLRRCEVDVESFIASQRPVLKPIADGMSEKARTRVLAEQQRWADREAELMKWLRQANSWQRFVDFWAVDWDYGRRTGLDGKPIFETAWQSFRVRGGKAGDQELAFRSEFEYVQPGYHRIAARVTDVFGNDGIATVEVTVK